MTLAITVDEWQFLGVVFSAVIITGGPLLVQLVRLRAENRDQHDDVADRVEHLIERNDEAHYLFGESLDRIEGRVTEHLHDHSTGSFDNAD